MDVQRTKSDLASTKKECMGQVYLITLTSFHRVSGKIERMHSNSSRKLKVTKLVERNWGDIKIGTWSEI